ncbi:hypothetical protein [Myxococcus landrumensis]|uniref:Transcriptional regulator n=1 Tax=Myxococcus landrumensis TaxID=2813577 RepID=A0ABX7N8N8_9BACT|nr:hypothetical protein [Myxococcus landrumus]QSQ14826.1 hypothetical protein JY572_01670 [Myxococcus landrumus]
MSPLDWLEAAARRSSLESWTLGHAFERYRELEERTPAQLAEDLGCTQEQVQWLALCHRPEEGEGFAEQVGQLAKRFEVDLLRLTRVLRRVEVMDALQLAGADGEEAGEDAVLLAARDRSGEGENHS